VNWKKLGAVVAAGILAVSMTSGAHATILLASNLTAADGNQFGDGDPTVSPCTGCLGLVGASNADFTSSTEAFAYAQSGGSNIAAIISVFNTVTGGNTSKNSAPLDPADFERINISGSGENHLFTLQGGITALKYSTWVSFLWSPTAQQVTYLGDPGVSNITQVPVPASLLLLIGGLGGLGVVARRRKVQAT
jgi:hypothetical protein